MAETDTPADTHTGAAVYDETLTQFASPVYRDGDKTAKAQAGDKLKELKDTRRHKGHKLTVKEV